MSDEKKTNADTAAAVIKEQRALNERKLKSLRQQIGELADALDLHSQKLDELQKKVSQVIEILSKWGAGSRSELTQLDERSEAT
jgi:uncharacterized coiled-coil DUF342 family protein